jgi:tripartite-type tricarboxylate transporter receptor subunit TctC
MHKFLAAALTVSAASLAQAQDWPAKNLTFVVPFAAGGGTDAFARPLGAILAKQLGRQIVNDNRGGAGGNLGAGIAARAAKDGYTYFVGAVHHTIAPSVYRKLDYNLEKDFAPLAVVAVVPQVIVISPKRVKETDLPAFVAMLKKNPGKLNYASAGAGTSHHLAGELFKIAAGVNLAHIPHKGAGPALQDLLAGQVDVMFDGMGSSAQHIKSGLIMPLAVASRQRSAAFPYVPTAAEAGLKGYEVATWYGLWAVAGAPQNLNDRMVKEVATALATPDLKNLWALQGATTGPANPKDMAVFVSAEIAKWAKVAKSANITVE